MLQLIVNQFVYSVLGLPEDSKFASALNFFIYDSIKIIFLLFVMIFLIGFLRTFLPQQRIRQWLINRGFLGNLYAAIFGAITPFCSCSSIPIFLSFLKAGIPLGVGFSFLITSPIINEYLVVLMLGYFGWKITLAYVISGLLIGLVGGIVLGTFKIDQFIVRDFIPDQESHKEEMSYRGTARLRYGLEEAVDIVRKIWLWILIGVGIGAVIHDYVPQQAIQAIISATGIFSVPLATLLGVPIYGSCAAIVPIAVVLFQKGVPLGTAMAFMMGVAALSLPEAVMLRRAMRLQLILLFFAITSIAIIFIGYLLNFLQPFLVQ